MARWLEATEPHFQWAVVPREAKHVAGQLPDVLLAKECRNSIGRVSLLFHRDFVLGLVAHWKVSLNQETQDWKKTQT